jgi:hypothetical protein
MTTSNALEFGYLELGNRFLGGVDTSWMI